MDPSSPNLEILSRRSPTRSRATVLEISGADILNRYIGGGEKIIRAVFSLARKLHPCVVFLDEADRLFKKREDSDSDR